MLELRTRIRCCCRWRTDESDLGGVGQPRAKCTGSECKLNDDDLEKSARPVATRGTAISNKRNKYTDTNNIGGGSN